MAFLIKHAINSEQLKPLVLKRWTVGDYHSMSELGILGSDERTELIGGQIALMAPKGTQHVTSLYLLSNLLKELLGNKVYIRLQDPIQLNDFSEPEPDLAIVKGTILDYVDHHPQSKMVELVVEVADSSLKQDCEIKAMLYAQAGIADYWVVDVNNRQLHVFRVPGSEGYTSHLILNEPNEISPLSFPHSTISLSRIFLPNEI